MTSTPQHIILGGNGPSAGKSSAASAFPHPRLAFADALKDLIADLYSLSRDALEKRKNEPRYPLTIDGRELAIIAYHIGQRVPMEGLFKRTFANVREVLQVLGTDVIRAIDPDWHVNKLLARMQPDVSYCIDDARFGNELLPGAVTIYVTRPGYESSAHESETTLSAADFTHVVVNDGSVEELREKVLAIVNPKAK